MASPQLARPLTYKTEAILRPFTQEDCTEELLLELTREWQRRLMLQDWLVKVYFVRGSEITGKAGRTNFQFSKKQAVIRLTELADSDGWDIPYDVEKTLVHELLHLSVAGTDPDGNRKGLEIDMEEQCVDSLAVAFIAIKRGTFPLTLTGKEVP
jgi:hypothetical protein